MEMAKGEDISILLSYKCGTVPAQNAVVIRLDLDSASGTQSLDLVIPKELAEGLQASLGTALQRLQSIQ